MCFKSQPEDPALLPVLFSPEEAAERLGISPSTLSRLVKAGRIRPVRFRRSIRYTDHALRELIQNSTVDQSGGSA